MSSLEALFWDVDDFCRDFEAQWKKKLLHQHHGKIRRLRAKSLHLSEIMTILIAFHRLGARSLASDADAGSHRRIIIVTSSTSIKIM